MKTENRMFTFDDETNDKLQELADSLTEGNRSLMLRQLIRDRWSIHMAAGQQVQINRPIQEPARGSK